MSSLLSLESFSQRTDQQEIIDFINFLESSNINSIEQLADFTKSNLGQLIKTTFEDDGASGQQPLIDSLTRLTGNISAEARKQKTGIPFGAPKTARDQESIDGTWAKLSGSFTGGRRLMVNHLATEYQKDHLTANSDHPFEAFSTRSYADLSPYFDRNFFESMATDYIDLARRYLNVHRINLELVGRIVDDNDKGVPNVLLKEVDINNGNELTGREVRTNSKGFFTLNFTKVRELNGTDSAITYPTDPANEVHDFNFTIHGGKFQFADSEVIPFSYTPTTNTGADPETVPGEPQTVPQVRTQTVNYSPPDWWTIDSIVGSDEIDSDLKVAIRGLFDGNPPYEEITLQHIREIGLLRMHNLLESYSDLHKQHIEFIDGMALFESADNNRKRLEVVRDNIFNHSSHPYKSPFELAFVSQSRFVSQHASNFEMHSDIGEGQGAYQAALLYESCLNWYMLLITSDDYTSNGLTEPFINDDGLGNPLLPRLDEVIQCGCDDCNSVVGPQAYLTDLLSFTTHNLFDNSSTEVPVDASWIEQNLHQNLDEIPAECDSLNDNVCQARIACEVLFKTVSPSDLSNNTPLKNKVMAYIAETYKSTLIKLGTTYDELQEYQLEQDSEKLLAYAHRLGIVLEYNLKTSENQFAIRSTIEDMYKDISDLTVADEANLLLQIFGIPVCNSHLDYTFTDGENWIQRWKRFRLRELWREQDHIDNPYFNGEKPIIDPDIVTVDDFRTPIIAADIPTESIPSIGGNGSFPKYFDLWEHRRTFLDTLFNNFYQATITENAQLESGLKNLFLKMADSGAIYRYTPLEGGAQVDLDATWPPNSFVLFNETVPPLSNDVLINDYWITSDELARLLELEKNDDTTDGDITEEERIEAVNLCVNVFKRRLSIIRIENDIPQSPYWVVEEEDLGLTLSPKFFTPAVIEPRVGSWPIPEIGVASELPSILPENIKPFLDPESITEAELPDLKFRKTFASDPLDQLSQNVQEANQFTSFEPENAGDPLLTFIDKINATFLKTGYDFDSASTNLVALRANLDDPASSETATEAIEGTLRLSPDDFIFLVDKTLAGFENTSQTEKDRLWSILISANTQFNLYPTFIASEQASSTLKYWAFRKAKLPKWRASIEERQGWLNALKEHSEAPVIDPNLIGPAYFQVPYSDEENPFGNVFDIWSNRAGLVIGDGQSMKTKIESETFDTIQTKFQYNKLLSKYLFSGSGLSLPLLTEAEENGTDLAPYYEMLNISSSDYRFFEKCLGIIPEEGESGDGLSENQKERLYYTLIKALKVREHLTWKTEEISILNDSDTDDFNEEPITLSPDFFRDRNEDYTVYPPKRPYELNEYLVSETDLNTWRRTVSSRKQEEETLLRELEQAMHEVDDEHIASLRDALVEEYYDVDLNSLPLFEKARRLGDRYLIDLQDNCCRKTNRTAQAIETLQQLIWKTHTRDIVPDHQLDMSVSSFDDTWKWMGSYANWRASMFVYLYPENILLPSFKNYKTPGFQNLLDQVQNNRRFNPGMACEVVNDFQQYIEDINSLKLNCSAQLDTYTSKSDTCRGTTNKSEPLIFIFATAENSGKIYYTTVLNAGTNSPLEQRKFWREVPGVPAGALIKGCDVLRNEKYRVNDLHLFYLKNEVETKSSFFNVRYDFYKNEWKDETKFDIRKDDFSFDIREKREVGEDTQVLVSVPPGLTQSQFQTAQFVNNLNSLPTYYVAPPRHMNLSQ